jgi:hypothetical protein
VRLTSSYMENLWANAGPFVGVDRSNARVTVEKDWYLNTTLNVLTTDPTKLPYRWWQRLDNSQVETDIPNIKSIQWDRSIDSDAASCTIVIVNQKMQPNASGQNRRLGVRGYYSWRERGVNALAQWPENSNTDWTDVLVPNALLRTYEGFGGYGKTLSQALNDGNLFLTGVWLVDEIDTDSTGVMQLKCRDMAKLLLEQQLYIPLMPKTKYPLHYFKWSYQTSTYVANNQYDFTDPVAWGPGSEGPKYITDFGVDADGDGYAILGTDGGVFCYATSFYGSRGGGVVTGVVGLAKRPQNDGYWAVDRTGTVYAMGAALNYGSPNAVASPVTRMAATHTGLGYWVLTTDGDVIPFGDAVYWGGSPQDAPTLVDIERTSDSQGYWLVAQNGAVYSYGNAVYHGNATIASGQTATSIAATPDNGGYWICATDGAVYALGNAVFYGRVTSPNAPIVAVIATPSGSGYWLLGQDGGVFAFGDAGFHGSLPPTTQAFHDMAATAGGYWLLADDGMIYPYGSVVDYGHPLSGVDPAPMEAIAMDPLGRGYWLAEQDGAVYAFGECGFYGRVTNPNAPITAIIATPSGRGYWLVGQDGGVFAFGDAPFLGSGVGFVVGTVVDAAQTSTGRGYWLLTDVGDVYAFGDAPYHGNAPVTPPDKASGIAGRPQNDGYWIVSQSGGIFAMGAAPFLPANGPDWNITKAALNDPIFSVESSKTGNGYLLLAGDGGVFSFGDAPFEGSLPADYSVTKQFPGDYSDLTDIVRDLLLWSGWYLYGAAGTDPIFGNLENTGTFVNDEIPADNFDKKPIIDAINAVRDIVGFLFWIDEEGGARFEPANWYTYGNTMQETGLRVGGIPEISEKLVMTQYSLTYTDRTIRSEIIITSDDPAFGNASTITTVREVTSDLLRGMIRPAMIPTPINVSQADQAIMAQLIEQHIHFQSLQGSVTCVANPAIQVNDQVRLWEQVAGETDVHFIRGISSSHDLDTGVWLYTLTTNHLGSGRDASPTGEIPAVPVPVS